MSESSHPEISLEKIANEIAALNQKTEQLQHHNFTLAVLIANLIDGEAVSGSIQELSVLLDLSKEDLRIAQKLISTYDGNIELLKKSFNNPNGKLSEDNLLLIVQAFKNSTSMIENSDKIIADMQK